MLVNWKMVGLQHDSRMSINMNNVKVKQMYYVQKRKTRSKRIKSSSLLESIVWVFLLLGNCVNYGHHHNMVFLYFRHTLYYYDEHGSIVTVSNTKPFSKHIILGSTPNKNNQYCPIYYIYYAPIYIEINCCYYYYLYYWRKHLFD